LLLRARALLLNGARLVELSWGVPFSRAVNFTCRKNATLVWKELPGGQASGKISQYTISADGNSGKIGGTVTIMATVGRGVSETSQHAAVTGDLYVVTGYVADGYFAQPGQQVTLIGGAGTSTAGGFADVAYSPPVASAIDNPMPLTRDDVLVSAHVHGSVSDQAALILDALGTVYSAAVQDMEAKKNATSLASSEVQYVMQGRDIFVEIVLRNVDSLALEDASDLNVQPLLVPQTLNLEALSA
jgi:hypothetical protein